MSAERVGRGRRGLSSRKHSPNMEDYLEAIRALIDEYGVARVTHMSEALHVVKPSVTAAVTKLAAEGLVTEQTLDQHVQTLRQKLGLFSDYVQSVPYVGYRFKA